MKANWKNLVAATGFAALSIAGMVGCGGESAGGTTGSVASGGCGAAGGCGAMGGCGATEGGCGSH